MELSCIIRPMRESDIPAVLEIQEQCYSEIPPETAESVITKLTASPATCYVACKGDLVIGYLLALPWHFESPPAFNAEISGLPGDPDTLYLHDLAVSPAGRGSGAGRALVDRFIELARELNLSRASLIAVQNSARYWQRYLFQPVERTPIWDAKLSTYGDGAQYMSRSI